MFENAVFEYRRITVRETGVAPQGVARVHGPRVTTVQTRPAAFMSHRAAPANSVICRRNLPQFSYIRLT